MTTAHDLGRIPEPYRARVEREMDEAAEAVHMRRTRSLQGPADAEADQAARAVLARYLEIADEADAAAHKAADEARDPARNPHSDREWLAAERAKTARAEVWRARMAEVEREAHPIIVAKVPEDAEPAADGSMPLVECYRFFGNVTQGETLTISSDDGLRMVLDALLRYLADKPAEALRVIAALINATPHSGYPMVSLGTTERTGFDMLAALGSKVRAIDSTRPDHMLEYATHEVDGVRFDAAHTRPMTDEERARAAREACTGVSASWCPVHGDCSCPRLDTGEREEEAQDCPLHGEKSAHGDERAQVTP
jgi:hypothetical protein